MTDLTYINPAFTSESESKARKNDFATWINTAAHRTATEAKGGYIGMETRDGYPRHPLGISKVDYSRLAQFAVKNIDEV